MPEVNFTAAATTEQLGENRIFCTAVGGHAVLLCRVGDSYHAVENRCSHAEATFEHGRLRGHKLLCPLHGAIFDVRDGKVLGPPAFNPIRCYPVRVVGDQVQVAVPEASAAEGPRLY
jgi:3-phenylpropionate/trans-cinnamate dioxygenase ferredoxin subunit